MNVEKLHQFVVVEKGPINAAVIDMLEGNLYQVENRCVEALEEGKYGEIPEFLAAAREEGLLIEVDERSWVPHPDLNAVPDRVFDDQLPGIELHLEEGVDIDLVLDKFKHHELFKIVYFGANPPDIQLPRIDIVQGEKDFNRCAAKTRVNNCCDFDRFSEASYRFYKKYNRCWGGKVAVTKDGKIRPCIYSAIAAADITTDDADDILEKLKAYWTITKDKVEKCKECELRYICFDCRELACRQGGDLLAAHAACCYDPYTGTWKEDE